MCVLCNIIVYLTTKSVLQVFLYVGGNPEALATRVRRLDQSSLPFVFRNGGCPLWEQVQIREE